jgi:hypothetical protein
LVPCSTHGRPTNKIKRLPDISSCGSAKLSAQLDRADYAKVNKILETPGGTWNKKANARVVAGCGKRRGFQVEQPPALLLSRLNFSPTSSATLLLRKLVLAGFRLVKPGGTMTAIRSIGVTFHQAWRSAPAPRLTDRLVGFSNALM